MLLFRVVYGFISGPSRQYHPHCRSLSQALDKDRCYCEKPFHFLSLDDLIFFYGDRQQWWGDFNAHETRILYHRLLPVYYLFYMGSYDIAALSVKTFQTRKAVKEYARRRSYFPVRFLSTVVDTARNLWHHKRWSPLGATYDELWHKYKRELQELHPELSPQELDDQVATTIVLKSCRTNPWIDYLCS